MVELRGDRGLSHPELAELAGMDANYVWRIEAGRQNLSVRNVARLAKALGVSLSTLFEGVDVADVPLTNRPYGRDAVAPEGDLATGDGGDA